MRTNTTANLPAALYTSTTSTLTSTNLRSPARPTSTGSLPTASSTPSNTSVREGFTQAHPSDAWLDGRPGFPPSEERRRCFPREQPDMSTLVELWNLDQSQGPIDAGELADAIERGVGDLDGQAAGKEFDMVMDWASRNAHRLSPEARKVLDIYAKHAHAARAQGQSGIPQGEFRDMLAEMRNVKDVSVSVELERLDRTSGPVNGDQMADAIRRGVADLDGKAATEEFNQFAEWAEKNRDRLTPEAIEVLDIYTRYVESAQDRGLSGIPDGEFRNMVAEMDAVRDASVSKELSQLDKSQGPINGDQMTDAIRRGTQDADGKAATDEFKQFADWAKKNQHRLSPEAKQVMATYEKYAKAAQAKGQSGIAHNDYQKMLKEMRNVKDASVSTELSRLDRTQGPINGDQLAAAIRRGVGDADGKAATDEFKQFADWAKKNESRLSPEAKQVMAIYEKHAKAAQARGQSGLSDAEFRGMVKEMHAVRDASASQALLDLSLTPGRVGGRQMLDAIRRGTQDADGKAATDEFKMFADWARANPDKLTPEARRVLDVYKKYAQSAQAQGQSGIAHNDYQQMLREMKEAARPRPVFSLHAARAIAG